MGDIMTDKDIREAAQALIQMLELNKYRGVNTSLDMEVTKEFKALKAALKPSKEEVADYLGAIGRETRNDPNRSFIKQDEEWLDQAIEYLREDK